jgi:D-glycero-beta-D-manno-heptose 1-phosphate adenylyltransferase
MRRAQTKIVPRHELCTLVTKAKKAGKRIVLANGCFDTLHVGHIRYLEAAKREGDILVVAVNADTSLRHLKGTGRPILNEQSRAQLVGAIRAVDYVLVFPESNVEKLLEEFRPDVHAKGTDYTSETVPERAVADRLGIRVAIVGDPKDHSTRGLLDSIRKAPHA